MKPENRTAKALPAWMEDSFSAESSEPIVDVSVVVPCRNEANGIAECLESICCQIPPPGGFEVIVVDGMSNDGTRTILNDLMGQWPHLRVVDNPAQITPSAMNCGIRAAKGQWIAIMGAHSRYAPDYLVKCLEVAEQSKADNVGGSVHCVGESYIQKAVAAAHHCFLVVGGAKWHTPSYEGFADTVFGGFYRRQVFDRIGLFDETMVRNQDDELNLRLSKSGGRIYHSPLIQSWYCPRSSLKSLFMQHFQYGYWKAWVVRKHRMPGAARHLVPGGMTLFFGMFATLSLWSQAARWIFVLLTACYFGFNCLASILCGVRSNLSLVPVLPLVIACFHWGYGTGFMWGVLDAYLRRLPKDGAMCELTRS